MANASDPEAVTGYGQEVARGFMTNMNLEIKEPIHYGAWSEREEFLSYQDLLLALKAARDTRIRDEISCEAMRPLEDAR